MSALAVLLAAVVVLSATPALAQPSNGARKASPDSATEASPSPLRGNILTATNETLLVRTDKGETRLIDMSAVPAAEWHSLEPGEPVTIEGKFPFDEPETFMASRIRRDPNGRRASYRTTRGVVRSVAPPLVVLRTTEGQVLALDVSTLPSGTQVGPNDAVIVTYEQQPQRDPVVLWLERDSSPPVETASAPPPAPEPPAPPAAPALPAPPIGSYYARLHGRVESIGASTLTLKTDDGQLVAFDVSRVNPQAIAATRPGDVVSVFGHMIPAVFRAESLQKE
jgi:hypothetical protein